MSENKRLTIREFFEKELDSKDVFLFRMVYDGSSYAGTDKKPTRVSIIIPKEIAENNLKFMSNWNFFIIGFKHNKKEVDLNGIKRS